MKQPTRRLLSFTKEIYSSLTLESAEELLQPYFHEFHETALRCHADHSQHGYDFAKFVEGHKDRLLEEWSQCNYAYCKKRYNMLYESETLEV